MAGVYIQGYTRTKNPNDYWFEIGRKNKKYTIKCKYIAMTNPHTHLTGWSPDVVVDFDEFEFLKFVIESLMAANVPFSYTEMYMAKWLQ